MASNGSPLDPEVLSRLGSLDDPVRRRLYEYVRDCEHPAGRDQAAAATNISRTLSAYHMDKLVEAGLLTASYARPPGRSGPGAGRPAKIYRMATGDLTLSVPPRAYELLARLLVSSVDHDSTGAVQEAINAAAYDTGRRIGADTDRNLMTVLNGCGYQPRSTDEGEIELSNCPFHALAQENQGIVCDLNLNLIQGVLDGDAQDDARAELVFKPNRCCITIHNAQPATSTDPNKATSADTNKAASRRNQTAAGRHAATGGLSS